MKDFVSLACLMLSIMVAAPLVFVGLCGLGGGIADASYAENVYLAVPCLAIGGAILSFSTFWLWLRFKR